MLGISVGTVKSTTSAALTKLRGLTGVPAQRRPGDTRSEEVT
jgi:hypothetical protein